MGYGFGFDDGQELLRTLQSIYIRPEGRTLPEKWPFPAVKPLPFVEPIGRYVGGQGLLKALHLWSAPRNRTPFRPLHRPLQPFLSVRYTVVSTQSMRSVASLRINCNDGSFSTDAENTIAVSAFRIW